MPKYRRMVNYLKCIIISIFSKKEEQQQNEQKIYNNNENKERECGNGGEVEEVDVHEDAEGED